MRQLPKNFHHSDWAAHSLQVNILVRYYRKNVHDNFSYNLFPPEEASKIIIVLIFLIRIELFAVNEKSGQIS